MTLPRLIIEGDITEETPGLVRAFLGDSPGKVVIEANSCGGEATAGAAGMALLERRAKDVTVRIIGVAASSASLLVMGAGRIIMHRAAHMMIHEPWAGVVGTADEMRKVGDDLEKISRTYAECYARATGHPVARIMAWMRAETWMTAEEALALNFCDEIEEAGEARPVARFDYGRFRHPPPGLLRLAQANGWAAAPPDAGNTEKTHAA